MTFISLSHFNVDIINWHELKHVWVPCSQYSLFIITPWSFHHNSNETLILYKLARPHCSLLMCVEIYFDFLKCYLLKPLLNGNKHVQSMLYIAHYYVLHCFMLSLLCHKYNLGGMSTILDIPLFLKNSYRTLLRW